MKDNLKTILLILLIGSLIALAGCTKTIIVQAPATEDTQTKADTKTTPTTTTKTTETKPTQTTPTETKPTQTITAKQPSEKVSKLLSKHISRVQSMSYMYQDETNYPGEWKTYAKDNKIHVKLEELKNVKDETYVDNIYLDTSAKTAEGYCEAKVYRCKDTNKKINIDYNIYSRKTPLDWIKKITYAEEIGSETRQQRNAIIIEYTEGSSKIMLWVDEFYGIPMEVRVSKNGKTNKYIYEDLTINSVKDSETSHEEILATYNTN